MIWYVESAAIIGLAVLIGFIIAQQWGIVVGLSAVAIALMYSYARDRWG